MLYFINTTSITEHCVFFTVRAQHKMFDFIHATRRVHLAVGGAWGRRQMKLYRKERNTNFNPCGTRMDLGRRREQVVRE